MPATDLLLDIFLTFMRLGLTGFGGTNLAEMERLLVGQKDWIDARTFANGFALGQLMPGPNLLAVTHYGLVIAGGWGAFAATVGFYGPTAVLSAAAALLWKRHSAHPWSLTFRNALLPFGGGVLLAGVLVLGQTSIHSWAAAALAASAFVILRRTRLNSALVVVGAAVLGALMGL